MPILGKISSKLPLIGKLGGVFMAASASAPYNNTDAFGLIGGMAEGAIKQLHFPNVEHVVNDLLKGINAKPMKQAIVLAVAGELMGALGVQTKYAKLIKDFGYNAAMGVAALSIIGHSTLWFSPGPQSTIKDNFAAAPMMGAYDY